MEFIVIYYPNDYDCFIVEYATLEEAVAEAKKSPATAEPIVVQRVKYPENENAKTDG